MELLLGIFGIVGTLLGTSIGAFATLEVQNRSNRAAEQREALAHASALRAEKKTVIEEFYDIYQQMERRVSDNDPARPSELSHRMWFLHNKLALICSDQLQAPLSAIARELNKVYWHGVPGGKDVWDYLHPYWSRFRESARTEIDATS
ncbi:hypothetical protein ABZV58_18325 [Nocardia sp. NPDC004654]|uniref:hypothetical protein n=1 Tax=Nocardia sp. NPDC004654 TaxID=3154776 RepID=UPI0033BE06E1